MLRLLFPLLFAISFAQATPASPHRPAAPPDNQSSYDLIRRILPDHAGSFMIENLPHSSNKDSFQLESRAGKIILRANNGVAIASALYYYLKNFCHCQITWNGTNLRLPTPLPEIKTKLAVSSPYADRYYLNYCTFNYSMSWWDWPRWEKEIDWMALHGINMPLAITGEEYTWDIVYKEMGFSDAELNAFFSGPAYFAWLWMGNLDGWGGPLSRHWMTSHRDLQLRILERERALGMTPILPAFTGHVPPGFQKHFPSARLKRTNWTNGFADTYILDAHDSLFAVIGQKFLETQTRLFGTNHLYSADTFNENEPPSDDSTFLSELSRRVYEGMHQVDTSATWVMQGWLFFNDRKFWKTPQVRALLDAVPGDHLLLLDLAAEIEPIWKRTGAFDGKPWIWNMINNFGGNVNLFGRMDTVATSPALALQNPASGKMVGIGLTMEAIAQNPVIYELMMDNVWQSQPIDLDAWLGAYVRNRYGFDSKDLLQAWQILRQTAYTGRDIRDGAESILTGRPTFDSTTVWTRTKLNYPPHALLPAWDLFIHAAPSTTTQGFLFDLTDLTRQILANYADELQKKWVNAFHKKDTAAFNLYSRQFLTLIDDLDHLLATRSDFLLGPWITAARNCGITPAEKDVYERNARDLITLWGDTNNPLHEYANRQWSGLLTGFYKVRWQKFFAMLHQSLRQNTPSDLDGFEKSIRAWEWHWVNEHQSYPTTPTGDSRQIALELYHKYRQPISAAYTRQASAIDITTLGAKGDSLTVNTTFIQQAIDSVAATGGGLVLVPAGKFVTGPLHLRTGVELHLADNAVLEGSTLRTDYGGDRASALLIAAGAHDISITGKGIIDGRGREVVQDVFRMLRAGTLQDPEWQHENPWHQKRPIESNRPGLIDFKHCDNVKIVDVTLKDAACWVQTYTECNRLTLQNMRVISMAYFNNDGIDVVDCRNVRITGCNVNASDDGICLKSSNAASRCDTVLIDNCVVRSSASGIKFGTASRGGFHHVSVRNITLYDTYRSALALESVDGGTIEDVQIQGITARNTGNAIFIRLGHRRQNVPPGIVRHVTIRDVKVEVPAGKPDKGYETEGPDLLYPHNVFPSSIVGIPGHPVEDVTLENIEITYLGKDDPAAGRYAGDSLALVPENESDYPEFSMFGELPAWGFYVRHARDIHFHNITLRRKNPSFRPAAIVDDVQGFTMDHCRPTPILVRSYKDTSGSTKK
jgi:alpha-N-acetylglucosaminidase